jgi:hypothetical protein
VGGSDGLEISARRSLTSESQFWEERDSMAADNSIEAAPIFPHFGNKISKLI